jgi:hypothetical protein
MVRSGADRRVTHHSLQAPYQLKIISLAPATIKQHEILEWTETRELVKLGFSEAEINASSWLVAQKGSAHETASPGRFLLHCTQSFQNTAS